MSGDFWGSQEGCQGPSRPSGRNRGLPLRRRRGQGFFPARGSRERAEPRAGRFQSVSVPPDQAPTTGCCRASLVVLGGEGPSIAGKFLDGAVFPGVGRWNIHFLFFRLPSSLKILLLRKADLTSLCLCRVLGARGPRFPLQPSQRGNPGLGWPPLDLGRAIHGVAKSQT